MQTQHPQQPLVHVNGIKRFLQNNIIVWLCDTGRMDLNEIATMGFSDADHCQLAQLLGYSAAGFHDLSYVHH